MTTKSIEFKATLNTSEMDTKIQQLQQKLKTIASATSVGDKARSIYGADSPMTERSQRLQESFNQRNLQMLRQEFDIRDRLYKAQENNLKQIQIQADKAKKGSREELELLEKKIKSEEKMLRLQSEQNVIAERYKSTSGSLQGLGAGFGGGAGGPPSGIGGQMAGGGSWGDSPSLAGMLMKGMGAQRVARMLIQGVQGAANFGASMYEHPQEKAREQAGIAQGAFATSGARSMLTGQGVRSMFFAQERMRAMQNAQTAQGAINMRGFGETVGEIGGSALAGAGTGAMIGAGIGSVVPMLGTAVGGVAGGVIGANLGAIGGFGSSLLKGQTGAGIRSALSGENPMEGIARFRAEQFFQNMQANQKSEEARDPYKQVALDFLESNSGKILQAQQMSGMNDTRMMNAKHGFLSAAGGMFTTEQKLGAMGEIYGAGGSSAQGRNAGEALAIKRGFGVQGAAGIMGALSGNIGGGQIGSDAVVRKILSEAFSVGLDASEFSRETEKFLSISAKFVEQSGARTPEAMSKVAETMGSFVVGDSMRQIEAAGEAKAFMESNLGAGGTQYQKALQMSKMRGSKSMSRLSEAQKVSLANMSPDQIRAGGREIDAMIAEGGFKSAQEFEAEAMEVKKFGMTQSASQASRLKKIEDLSAKHGVSSQNPEQIKNAIKMAYAQGDTVKAKELEEVYNEGGKFISGAKSELGKGGAGAQFGEALLGGQVGFGKAGGIKALMPEQAGGMFTERDKASAVQSQHELTNAMEYAEQYKSSVESISKSSAELAGALAIMSAAIKSGDTNAQKEASEAAVRFMSKTPAPNYSVKPPTGIKTYSGIK